MTYFTNPVVISPVVIRPVYLVVYVVSFLVVLLCCTCDFCSG